MGLWATGMDRYDQMLLLVNRWVTQIVLVASGGHLRGGVLVTKIQKISQSAFQCCQIADFGEVSFSSRFPVKNSLHDFQ